MWGSPCRGNVVVIWKWSWLGSVLYTEGDVPTCDPGWPRGRGSDEIERNQVPPAGPRQTQLGLGLRGWQGVGGPKRVRGAHRLLALPWGGGIRATCGLGIEQQCRGASTCQLQVSYLETLTGDVKPVVWLQRKLEDGSLLGWTQWKPPWYRCIAKPGGC